MPSQSRQTSILVQNLHGLPVFPDQPMKAPHTPPPPRQLRILLVQDQTDLHPVDVDVLRTTLADGSAHTVEVTQADIGLADRILAWQPDMIIIASESAARDTVEHVCVATHDAPRPIVLFTDNDDAARIRSALAAGITAYIVDGMRPERVKSVLDVAYTRFELEQALRAELDATRLQLTERKLVERAKGRLMSTLGLSEDQAYQRLRKLAMERGIKLGEAARRVLDVMGS